MSQTDKELISYIKWLGAQIDVHRDTMHELAVKRRRLVLELHQRHGYGTIAEPLGLSRARVAQMAKPLDVGRS